MVVPCSCMHVAAIFSAATLSFSEAVKVDLDTELIPRETDRLFGLTSASDEDKVWCTKTYEYQVVRESTTQILNNRIEFKSGEDDGETFLPDGFKSEKEIVGGDKLEHVIGPDEEIYFDEDWGLFSSVLTCYNNHWVLRTSPEDWWTVVARRVAQALDEHGENPQVRQFFVSHEGKKELNVIVGSTYANLDYTWLFNQFSSEVRNNINVPGYVDLIQADFSNTTDVQRIISQVMLMASVKKYFAFSTATLCGLPGVELKGSAGDWARLVAKLNHLDTMMSPIKRELGLEIWFNTTERVFSKLLETYNGQPDLAWWGRILSWERGGSGVRAHWEGWFPYFLGANAAPSDANGYPVSYYDQRQPAEPADFPSGLVSVPLHMEDRNNQPAVQDDGLLVAGTLGFTVEEGGRYPIVEPNQVWGLLLPKGSPLKERLLAT